MEPIMKSPSIMKMAQGFGAPAEYGILIAR